MALSVKAYLNPDTNQQEIRRFAIDEGASASYAYLAKKIEQVFPIVRGKIFKLFWKGKFRNNLRRVTVEIDNLASIARLHVMRVQGRKLVKKKIPNLHHFLLSKHLKVNTILEIAIHHVFCNHAGKIIYKSQLTIKLRK